MKYAWIITVKNKETKNIYSISFKTGKSAGQWNKSILVGDNKELSRFAYCNYSEKYNYDPNSNIVMVYPTRFRKIETVKNALRIIAGKHDWSTAAPYPYVIDVRLIDDKTLNTIAYDNMSLIHQTEYIYLQLTA